MNFDILLGTVAPAISEQVLAQAHQMPRALTLKEGDELRRLDVDQRAIENLFSRSYLSRSEVDKCRKSLINRVKKLFATK